MRPRDARAHNTAAVSPKARIHPSAEILQFAVVREGATVGPNTRICSHVYVDARVLIGKDCKIKNGSMLYEGVVIEDAVFVGPNVTFTNDPRPRALGRGPVPRPVTRVRRGATIGAGSVILPGIEIGEDAMVGAGSVVTKDVPAGVTVYGNPARKSS